MIISENDLQYAIKEWKEKSLMPVGSFDWQKELKKYSSEFWKLIVEIVDDSISILPDNDEFFKEQKKIYMLLHFIFSPVYSAYGKRLPGVRVSDFDTALRNMDGVTDIERLFLRLALLNRNWARFYEALFIKSKVDEAVSFNIAAISQALLNKTGVNSSSEKKEVNSIKKYLVRIRPGEKVTFQEIGGLIEAKKKVMRLSTALKSPEKYKRWGTRPPRGIIFYGPPGTGKTLLAKALAADTNMPFYNIPCSQILSMWYSQSEKNVDEVFSEAKKTGGIIFFDEADALVPSRANPNQHEATNRVIAALNRNMDGFEETDRVVVIFATNRLEDMDKAIVRAGRIDLLIEIPLPDKEARKEIFKIHIRKAEKIARRTLFNNINIDLLVEKTENWSGADIAEVIRRTLENKVEEEEVNGSANLVTTEDIVNEIIKYERRKDKEIEIKTIGFRNE